MREQGAGTIVNTSSIASKASMGIAAYQAANAAVNALTRHIAITYARDGIRANALLPGLLHTPMGINTYATDPEEQAKVIAKRNALVPLNAQFSAALPPELAERTLGERLADPEGAAFLTQMPMIEVVSALRPD